MKPTDGDRDPAFDRLIAGDLTREVDASGNACPDADLLAAWFDHTLSALESERIEAHASGCACCQQILAALARSEPVVVRAAPVPEPARPWHWHWRWLVPLATAVVVVVVGTRTLRAPGPVMVTGPTPAAQAPAIAELRAPEPNAVASGSQAPAGRVAEPMKTLSGGGTADKIVPPSPPAGPPPAPGRSELAPAGAPAVGAAPSAMKAEGQMAGMARRQAESASEQTLMKAAAPRPAAPALTETLSIEDRAARPALGLQVMQQVSVAAPTSAGMTTTWRFGQNGAIEKSSDRGQTWERQSSGVTTPLADASAPSDRVCWIVGAHGVVLRTTDGRTWQRLNSPTDADLVAVHAWSEASAMITASDRSVYETTDGGQSWRRRQP